KTSSASTRSNTPTRVSLHESSTTCFSRAAQRPSRTSLASAAAVGRARVADDSAVETKGTEEETHLRHSSGAWATKRRPTFRSEKQAPRLPDPIRQRESACTSYQRRVSAERRSAPAELRWLRRRRSAGPGWRTIRRSKPREPRRKPICGILRGPGQPSADQH